MIHTRLSETVVRYALGGINKPVGVAAWEIPNRDKALVDRVPEELHLPPVEQLQERLGRIVEAHATKIVAAEDEAQQDGDDDGPVAA